MKHVVKWKVVRGAIVVPPVIAKVGDTVKIEAGRTTGWIHVFFCDKRLFGVHQAVIRPGRNKSWIVKAVPYGCYAYAIYFSQWRRFGEGSSPIIIVRP